MSKVVKIFHGPQHPGITGNMSVELDLIGETIVKAKTHVGYLHRAFEKLVERRTAMQAFTIVCRICVPEPDPNEENFARAIEDITGLEVPERAKWIRVLVLELSRLAAYHLWMGGQAGSTGLYTVPQWAVGYRDYILDLFEELTGGRVYHMYIIPGGVRRDLPQGFLDRVSEVMDLIESKLPEFDRLFFDNAVFKKRAIGTAVIDPETAIERGVVGPPLRACGIASDVRRDAPYEVYDKLDFDVITETGGDVYARALVRRREMEQSIKIIRQIIKYIPDGPYRTKIPYPMNWKLKAGETYVKTESARGEFGYYMVTDGSEYIRRMHVRGPAYVHGISLLEDMLEGAQLADVAMIMNSLGTCPPEIER